MKLENFPEIKWVTSRQDLMNRCMSVYRQDHSYIKCFDFPEYFYFKVYNDRLVIHWAVIRKEENWAVYFINMSGRAFDKLEFKTKKQAQRALRRNKFYFSTNKYCPYKPISPIYINLGEGKKSAPYSKGNLWQSVKREQKQIKKSENTVIKKYVDNYNWWKDKIFLDQVKNILTSQILSNVRKEEKRHNDLITIILIIIGLCIFLYEYIRTNAL